MSERMLVVIVVSASLGAVLALVVRFAVPLIRDAIWTLQTRRRIAAWRKRVYGEDMKR